MAVVSCSRDTPTIVFVFPDGFKGLILFATNTVTGVDLPRVNGQYNIEVPENGKITVKNFKLFTQWHKVIVRYKNGEEIAYETATNDADIELNALPFGPDAGCYYFLGTLAEQKAFSKVTDDSILRLLGNGQVINSLTNYVTNFQATP